MRTERLNHLVESYIKLRQQEPDTSLEHCMKQEQFKDTIKYASLSEDEKGKRHPHQRRLKKIVLKEFSDNLVEKADEIGHTKNFKELYEIIMKYKVKGIGVLTVYDTALRIGKKLNILPDKVYLHAGAKEGAEKLLGRKITEKTLNKSDFPEPFQKLTEAEIEDILCTYKNKF